MTTTTIGSISVNIVNKLNEYSARTKKIEQFYSFFAPTDPSYYASMIVALKTSEAYNKTKKELTSPSELPFVGPVSRSPNEIARTVTNYIKVSDFDLSNPIVAPITPNQLQTSLVRANTTERDNLVASLVQFPTEIEPP